MNDFNLPNSHQFDRGESLVTCDRHVCALCGRGNEHYFDEELSRRELEAECAAVDQDSYLSLCWRCREKVPDAFAQFCDFWRVPERRPFEGLFCAACQKTTDIVMRRAGDDRLLCMKCARDDR
jgi:hypothetical protein